VKALKSLRALVLGAVIVAVVGGVWAVGHGSNAGVHKTGHHAASAAPERDTATDAESGGLNAAESYWNDRVTYPTGKYNPAWLRQAAAHDSTIARGVPAASTGGSKPGSDGLSTTAFTALGPQPEHMTNCGNCYDYTTTEGRINAIVVDPTTTTNGSIVAYAGSVGGGVWKTTNCCSASTTWTVTTDDPLIASISIDTLAIDPQHHNTIYAGTGDLNFGSFSMGSQGILKSTDAGAHWTVLGANVFGPGYTEPAGQFPQYDAVGKVRVDPNNSSRVLAGTKKGLFLSYDGGVNWTGPCLTNSFLSQRQDITGLELSDMGGGVTRIVAAVGVRGFATPVQYDLGNNGANGIYSATVPASGCPSFTSIASNANGFVFGTQVTGSPYTTGANMNAGTGTPYSNPTTGDQLGRVDIAVAPSNPNYIYAQVQSIAPNSNGGCGNTNGCQLGVFVTRNGGSTWKFMDGSAGGSLRNCTGGTNPADYPQNWYDQGIAVDPNDPERIFVDTFDIWFATRTGSTFTDLTCGYNGPGAGNHVVHVDQHELEFVSGSSSILLIGSDGGAFSTSNADVAPTKPTFVNMDGGLNTIEFYSGDISGNFATSPNPSAAGGAQDNAPSVVGFTGTPTGPAQWQTVTGGDGFYARIDPVGTGSSLRYFVGNNSGGLYRCTSACLANGFNYNSVAGSWGSDTKSFILPFDIFHGGTPGGDDCAPAGVPGGCGHLVAGTTRVWETIAGGNSSMSGTWYVTNNPATQNMTKQTLGNRSFINQVKYSPKWQSSAIVGTNDANVWIGFNLGTGSASQANWVNVTGGNTVLPNRPVLGIALDPSAPSANVETGYAAVGGFNANTPSTPGHVFRVVCNANCASFTWTNKSGNLPDIPVDSIIVNPNIPQQVFAGTDFGLYYTDDITQASPVWQKFTSGMPSVMIWDLQIDRGATTLSAWTRSRGAYVWPLPTQSQGPTITSFSPLKGITGTTVTIDGTGFDSSAKVRIGHKAAPITSLTPTEIQATVGNGATTGKVIVTTDAGKATSTKSFKVTMSITQLTPTSGPVGTPVTVSGVGFTGATRVKFAGKNATFSVTDDSTIETTVPAGATTGVVTVTGPLGTVKGPKFTVTG